MQKTEVLCTLFRFKSAEAFSLKTNNSYKRFLAKNINYSLIKTLSSGNLSFRIKIKLILAIILENGRNPGKDGYVYKFVVSVEL